MSSALRVVGGERTPEPKSGWAPIPYSLYSDPDLSPADVAVIAAVMYFQRGRDCTDATDSQIADFLHTSRATVSRHVTRLVEIGLLRRVSAGPSRTLATAFDPFESASEVRRKPENSASEMRRLRLENEALAPHQRGASASEMRRPLYKGQEKTLETAPASSATCPGGGSPPPPAKTQKAPPDPPPSPPRRAREWEPPEDAILGPYQLAMQEGFANGGGDFGQAWSGKAIVRLHHRAVEWYQSKGLPIPAWNAKGEEEARAWFEGKRRKLPCGIGCGEKTPAAGLDANQPPAAGGNHPAPRPIF